MLHKIEQIRSLRDFVEIHRDEKMTYYSLLNAWIRQTAVKVQDADTMDYYLTLIPMIERRLDAQ